MGLALEFREQQEEKPEGARDSPTQCDYTFCPKNCGCLRGVPGNREQKDEDLSDAVRGLQEGIELTAVVFKSGLERFDVKMIVPEVGKPFTASSHEDVGIVANTNLPAKSVAEVVKVGWVVESKPPSVIRKAH